MIIANPTSPNDLRMLLAAAIAHHQGGRLTEAEALYRRILAAAPEQIDALHLLGVIASQHGQPQTAIELIGRAITHRRANPVAEFHNNIGLAFRALRRADEAIEHFEQALRLRPNYAEAHNNLAAVLKDQGRLDEALLHCRYVVETKPSDAAAHYALGVVLHEIGQLDAAAASYAHALNLRPDYPEALTNLGTLQMQQDRLEQAVDIFRRALAMRPDYPAAHYNLGTALQDLGDVDDALTHYQRAIALQPSNVEAHFNSALMHLLTGDYASGWAEYEWRWRRDSYPPRSFSQPAWDGGPMGGRTILLHAEQGLGDTIQFIRYAPLVRARGGRVIAEIQPSLMRLLANAPGLDQVVRQGDDLPAFDCHAPLLSLPALFATDGTNIPAPIPYLKAEARLVEAWRSRDLALNRLNAGLVWRGNRDYSHDLQRSIPAEHIAPIVAATGLGWISLQQDATAGELARFLEHGRIRDCGPLLADWMDTAALIANLDLVVTVDTAVAHLAGALGVRTWVLLPHMPDWRWLRERRDCPWYPTLRLFRQPARGDWESVLAEVSHELASISR